MSYIDCAHDGIRGDNYVSYISTWFRRLPESTAEEYSCGASKNLVFHDFRFVKTFMNDCQNWQTKFWNTQTFQ